MENRRTENDHNAKKMKNIFLIFIQLLFISFIFMIKSNFNQICDSYQKTIKQCGRF